MKGVCVADDVKRLGDVVSFGEFSSGSFGRVGVPDPVEFAKTLARDLVVDVSSVEAGAERLGRGQERLAGEGVSRRSFGDFLVGAGLVGAGVLGSVPGVPGGLGRLDDVADFSEILRRLPFNEASYSLGNRGMSVREVNLAQKAARDSAEEIGRAGTSSGPGSLLLRPEGDPAVRQVPGGLPDFSLSDDLDVSEWFLQNYWDDVYGPLARGDLYRTERFVEAASKNLYTRGADFDFEGDSFETLVEKMMVAGVPEVEAVGLPRAYSPSYGPFLGPKERSLLATISVATSGVARRVASNSRNRAKLFDIADAVRDTEFSAEFLNSIRRSLVKFADENVPVLYPVAHVYDALRVLFEPRLDVRLERSIRVATSTREPDFLWFGYFNRDVAKARLLQAKEFFGKVNAETEDDVISALIGIQSMPDDLGFLRTVFNSVPRTDWVDALEGLVGSNRLLGNVLQDSKYLVQNQITQEFSNLLRLIAEPFENGRQFGEQHILEINDYIDEIIEILDNNERLISEMTNFRSGFGPRDAVDSVIVSHPGDLQRADNAISSAIADDNFNATVFNDAVETGQVMVPSFIYESVMSANDMVPKARIFSPFADVEITGSPLLLTRLGNASVPMASGTFATGYQNVSYMFSGGAVGESSSKMNFLDSMEDALGELADAANLNQRLYTEKFNIEYAEGWLKPEPSAPKEFLANDFRYAIVSRQIPIDTADGVEWYSEIDWYRIEEGGLDFAKQQAVRHGYREVVDAKTGDIIAIDDDEASVILDEIKEEGRERLGLWYPKNYSEGRDISPVLVTDEYRNILSEVSNKKESEGKVFAPFFPTVILDTIAKFQNFDAKPTLVSSTDWNALINEGWTPVFRGVQPWIFTSTIKPSVAGFRQTPEGDWVRWYDTDEYFLDFVDGDYSSGRGVYAQAGFYFASEFATTHPYSSGLKGLVVAGLVPPYAKFAPTSVGQLAWVAEESANAQMLSNPLAVDSRTDSLAFAIAGYDGVYTNIPVRGGYGSMGRRPEMVLFNRGMLAVYQNPIRVEDLVRNGLLEEFVQRYNVAASGPVTSPSDTMWDLRFGNALSENMADFIGSGAFDMVSPAQRNALQATREVN